MSGWRLRLSARELAWEAVAALVAHRLRAALSAVGIIVGVATVITAFAIGEGSRRVALAEIGALGIDNVFIRALSTAGDAKPQAGAPLLSASDAGALANALEPGTPVASARLVTTDAAAEGRHAPVKLAGVSGSWRQVASLEVASGRWLSSDDEISRRRVAIVGGTVARDLFGVENPVGHRIFTGGAWFSIVGVAERRANGHAPQSIQTLDTDRAVFVPISTMDVSLGAGDRVDRVQEIGIRTSGPAAVERTAGIVNAILTRRHPGSPTFEVIVPRELLQARLRAERTFSVVLIAVGLLALIISGVGIMNIMLASVAARVSEIGVRRAFGASRVEILAQFAIESMALCLAGGLAGVPLGLVFSFLVAVAAGWPVRVSPLSIAAAVALATSMGLIFGVYPARSAAAIEPVDALRAS